MRSLKVVLFFYQNTNFYFPISLQNIHPCWPPVRTGHTSSGRIIIATWRSDIIILRQPRHRPPARRLQPPHRAGQWQHLSGTDFKIGDFFVYLLKQEHLLSYSELHSGAGIQQLAPLEAVTDMMREATKSTWWEAWFKCLCRLESTSRLWPCRTPTAMGIVKLNMFR